MEEIINEQSELILPEVLFRGILKYSQLGLLLKMKSTCKKYFTIINKEIEERREKYFNNLQNLLGDGNNKYRNYAIKYLKSNTFIINPNLNVYVNMQRYKEPNTIMSSILYYIQNNNWEKIFYIMSFLNGKAFLNTIEIMFKKDKTLFHLACENGNIFLVKLWYRMMYDHVSKRATLLRCLNRDKTYTYGNESPLISAVKKGKKEVALFLLNLENVNKVAIDKQKQDVLDFAFKKEKNYVINEFIRTGNYKYVYLKCCKNGKKKKLESFNKNLYDTLDKKDIEQGLYYAIKYGRKQILQHLKNLLEIDLSEPITFENDGIMESIKPIFIAFGENQIGVANFLIDNNVKYNCTKLLTYIGNLPFKVNEAIINKITYENLNDDEYYEEEYYEEEYYEEEKFTNKWNIKVNQYSRKRNNLHKYPQY
jgi:hypothetical protein